jgi:hypothetical protein
MFEKSDQADSAIVHDFGQPESVRGTSLFTTVMEVSYGVIG